MSLLVKNALSKFIMSFFTRISNETAHQSNNFEKQFPDIDPKKIFPILIPNIPLKSIKINPNLLKYTHFSRKSPKIIIIMKSPIKSVKNASKTPFERAVGPRWAAATEGKE